MRRWKIGLFTVGLVVILFFAFRDRPDGVSTRTPAPVVRSPAIAGATASRPVRARPHISGRVLFDGQPFADATVRILPGVAVVTTEADGRFDLEPPPLPAREVMATAPGKRAAAAPIPAGSARQRMELVLGKCDATLSGRVRDVAGGAIARPFLRAAGAQGTTGEAVGDDSGVFSLCVTPGPSHVEVRATGYAAVSEAINVVPGARHDFVLSPEAVIEGRIIDAEDNPVPGSIAGAAAVGMQLSVATADEQGAFRLAGLAPGRNMVICSAHGWRPTSLELTATVEQPAHVECRLQRGRTIAGRVVSGDRAATGIAVAARGAGGSMMDQTDDKGAFSIDGLPDGELSLSVDSRDVIAQEPAMLPRSGDVSGVVLRLGPRTSIAGWVTRKGQPVPGASIELRGEGPERRATADELGAFTISDVTPGRVAVVATSDAAGATGNVELTIARGEAKASVHIELSVAGSVSGDVVDTDGAPVVGVLVRFEEKGGDEGHGVTGEDGRFRAAMLAGGRTYRAAVFKDGASMLPLPPAPGHSFPAVTVRDQETQVDGVRLVVSRAEGQITGRVVDEFAAPIADVTVGASEPGQTRFWLDQVPPAHTVTTMDGRFVLGGLPRGKYAVIARAPTGAMTIMLNVQTNADPVTLIIPAETQIVGTLDGFTGNVYVSATDGAGKSHRGVVEGSQFHIDRVPRGRAVVKAWQSGVGNSQLDVIGVDVAPPARAGVTLRPRPTYTLTGIFVDGTGAPIVGDCQVSLKAGMALEVTVSADGRFAVDVPGDLDGVLVCSTTHEIADHPLPAATLPGTSVDLRLVGTPR